MTDYAGVIAFRGNQVALVREHYEGCDEERWIPLLEAISLLDGLPYPPPAQPVAAHLRSTAEGLEPAVMQWTFTFDQDVPFRERA